MNLKKVLGIILLFAGTVEKSSACGGGEWEDWYYSYQLFMQEVIQSPEYASFLYCSYGQFYSPERDVNKNQKNDNIEAWVRYLGIRYDQASYLVYKSNREDLKTLLAGKPVKNDSLAFVNMDFVIKHRQALLYLSYAKYLEPYMGMFEPNGYWYGDEQKASTLDYEKVTTVLTKSWHAEKDMELKMRYGYQLVRFAHYSGRYEEAVTYFNQYVESLQNKHIMYYYALNQKAGAERGLGLYVQAVHHFLQVFTHSKSLRENAFCSIKLTQENIDLNDFLEKAKTNKERNDIYLLLGYQSFNNPAAMAEKIIKTNPDAVQAKILIARALYQLNNSYLRISSLISPEEEHTISSKRIPLDNSTENSSFWDEVYQVCKNQTEDPNVKDKDFWNYTTAFLCFMNKDYQGGRIFLDKIGVKNPIYKKQKQMLEMLFEVSETWTIDSAFEVAFFEKYNALFTKRMPEDINRQALEYIKDVLANRYFIQGAWGKSFAIHNQLDNLSAVYDTTFLNEIEAFCDKKKKNTFEQYLYDNMVGETDYKNEFNRYKGLISITEGRFTDAEQYFSRMTVKGFGSINRNFFGYNRIECFNCEETEVMGFQYANDFPFIEEEMDLLTTSKVLRKLAEIAGDKSDKGAKANYLLGNFFYNISSLGYFRSKFMSPNQNEKLKTDQLLYFRFYDSAIEYKDNYTLTYDYLTRAYQKAKDKNLLAQIAFALSKWEQAVHYQGLYAADSYYGYYYNPDNILISDREYFKELMKYKGSPFFKEVESNCMYFSYYVSMVGG